MTVWEVMVFEGNGWSGEFRSHGVFSNEEAALIRARRLVRKRTAEGHTIVDVRVDRKRVRATA